MIEPARKIIPYTTLDVALCSGFGKYHSPNNQQNPQPLASVTLGEILAMLAHPQNGLAKDCAQWAIFSTLPSRAHSEQRAQGEFYALWADFDAPDGLTLGDTLKRAGAAIPGDMWGYTSRSATEDCQKARIIIPLLHAVCGAEWVQLQTVLNHRLAAQQLSPDIVTERAGQPCYLPNRGDYYAHLSFDDLGPLNPAIFAEDVAALELEQAAALEAQKAAQECARQKAAQRVTSGELSPIAAYNAAYDLSLLLDSFGYRKKGNRWLSPNSQSRTPGVSLSDDGKKWLSAHGSDADIGRPTDNGSMGDAFDLFVYWEHRGDRDAALKAAGEMFTTPAGLTITQTNRFNHKQGLAAQGAPEPLNPPVVDLFGGLAMPAFPVELLPPAIARFAEDQAELIGIDPAIVGMSALGVAAACIDDRQEIQPKRHDPTWTESARLWIGIIGGPSSGKSPGIKKAMGPAFKVDSAWRKESGAKMQEWTAACEAIEKGQPQPEPPLQQRLIVSDATTEKLADILSRCSPRGMLCFMDELSGWLGSMDAYRNGVAKDRPAWLEAYHGGPKSIDRISRGSTFVENWGVSVLGGIQPDVVHEYARTTNHDGMLQRFLLVHAGAGGPGMDRPPDMAAKEAYSGLIEHLARLSAGPVVTLSEDAHRAREGLTEKLVKATRVSANQFLAATLGKWTGTFARLLLTYHCIELHGTGIHPSARPVSGETAERVATLMGDVLFPHAVRFYQGLDPAGDHSRQVAALILAKGWDRFTVKRDLTQSLHTSRNWKPWELDGAMNRLEGFGWITPEPGKINERGRPAGYTVNPEVHQRFTEQAVQERQRRADVAGMMRDLQGADHE